MKAVIISQHMAGNMIEIQVANDPFTCWVESDRLNMTTTKEHKMPTATKTSVKELRSAAKKANIDGWDEMDRDELVAALADVEPDEDEEVEEEELEDDDEEEAPKPAKKASKSTKKAPAKKASKAVKPAAKATKSVAKKVKAEAEEGAEGPNPFRPQSNLWHFTEALMKGGKRSAMVTKLERKVDLKPRVRGGRDYDVAAEIDYRLVRVCQLLANDHGFVIEKDGRGTEQKVQAIAPEDQ